MLLDNLTAYQLDTIDLTPDEIKNGYFLNNVFFNEIFSLGRMHMVESTVGGVMTFIHNEQIIEIFSRKTIIPMLLEEARTKPNVTKYYFFKDTTKLKFGGFTINFRSIIREPKERYVRYTSMFEKHLMFDTIYTSDLSFMLWFARNYQGSFTEDPNVAKVIPILINICNDLMSCLLISHIGNFERNRSRGKYGYSDEVILRQVSMAFWGLLSIRNLLTNGDCKQIARKDEFKWQFGIGGPCIKFEELCNLANGTNTEYAKEVFTPEFTKRESQGHAEVVVAIFKTL